MDTRKLFGQNLRRLRLQQKLSQQALADLLEVDVSRISEIERGRWATNLDTVDRCAKRLRVPVVELFRTDVAFPDPGARVPRADEGARLPRAQSKPRSK